MNEQLNLLTKIYHALVTIIVLLAIPSVILLLAVLGVFS